MPGGTPGILTGSLPAARPSQPSIQVLSQVQCGAVIPGYPQGFLVLNPFPAPGGSRTAAPGTVLLEDRSVSLGAFTLSGPPGASWTLRLTGPARIQLGGPAGPKPYVEGASLTLGSGSDWKGTFPAGPGAAGTTQVIYLGLAVQLPALTRPGLYTGTLPLQLRDGLGGQARTALVVTLQVALAPLTMAKDADMAFGNVMTGFSPGAVVLAPSGTAAASGGVTVAAGAGPAGFSVTGSPQAHFSIALPAGAVLSGPAGRTLQVTGFTSSAGSDPQLDATGNLHVKVGATLQVPALQAPGTYAGSFTVSVAYD